MKKRKKLDKRYSQKLFTHTAKKVHPKNAPSGNLQVARGGFRL